MRDADEAGELLRAWSRSGEPMSRWCAQRGINWYSLSAYRGWQDRGGANDDGFVEVVPTEIVTTGPSGAGGYYRVFVGEYVVEVGNDFDEEPLRRLLRVVASC